MTKVPSWEGLRCVASHVLRGAVVFDLKPKQWRSVKIMTLAKPLANLSAAYGASRYSS